MAEDEKLIKGLGLDLSKLEQNINTANTKLKDLGKDLKPIPIKLDIDTTTLGAIKSVLDAMKEMKKTAEDTGKSTAQSTNAIANNTALAVKTHINSVMSAIKSEITSVNSALNEVEKRISGINKEGQKATYITDNQGYVKSGKIVDNDSDAIYKSIANSLQNIYSFQKLSISADSEIKNILSGIIEQENKRVIAKRSLLEADGGILKNEEKEISLVKQVAEQSQKLADIQKRANTQQNKNLSTNNTLYANNSNLMGFLGSGDARAGLAAKALNSFVYGSMYRLQNQLYIGLKAGLDVIKQYETGINDLRRTLENVTNNELKSFGNTAITYSKDFGIALEQVQTSMTELARAGIDKTNLSGMTETVLMGLNTTEIKLASDMVGYLVSAVKQLNMSMNDSSIIIDSWNRLSDKYAVQTDDFAEAVSKAGSASKLLGLDLHDLNAMTVILGEATQASGKQVGDAIKAMEVRLLRPETVRTLEGYGIAVKKNAKEFLTFQEIMDNVNNRIKNLDENSVELNSIMDALGGAWRKNWVQILADDWGRFNQVVAESKDSVGYSLKENEKVMETFAKKVESFKNAWSELFVRFSENSGLFDMLKGLTDAGTSLVASISKVPAPLVKILTTLGAITISLKSLNALSKSQTGLNMAGWFADMFPKLGKNIDMSKAVNAAENVLLKSGISKESEAFAAIMSNVNTKLGLTKTVTTEAAAASKALAAAQKAAAIESLAFNAALGAGIFVIGALIAGAATLISNWIHWREEQGKLIAETQTNISSLKEQQAGIQALSQEYETLKGKEKNITLSADEKTRLLEIEKQLVAQYGVLSTGINLEGQAYADSSVAIKLRTQALNEEIAAQQQLLEFKQAAVDKTDVEEISKIQKRIEIKKQEYDLQLKMLEFAEKNNQKDVYSDLDGNFYTEVEAQQKYSESLMKNSVDDIRKTAGIYQQELIDSNKKLQEIAKDRSQILLNAANEDIKALEKSQGKLSDTAKSFIAEFAKSLSIQPEAIQQQKEALDEFISKLTSSNFDELIAKYQKLQGGTDVYGLDKTAADIKNLVESLAEGNPYLKDFIDLIEGMFGNSASLSKSSDITFMLDARLKSLYKTVNDITDDMKELNQIIYDVNNGQSLSGETVLALVEKYDIAAGAIKTTTDGYTIEASVLEQIRETKINTALTAINSEISVTEQVQSSVSARIKNYGIEIEQLQNLALVRQKIAGFAAEEAKNKANERFGVGSGAYVPGSYVGVYNSEEQTALRKAEADVAAYKKTVEEINALKNKADALKTVISNKNFGVNTNKSKSGSSGLGDKNIADEYVEAFNAQVKLDEAQLKHLDIQIKIADKQKDYNKVLDLTNQKLELQRKTIDDIKIANEKIHQQADKVRTDAKKNKYTAGYNTDTWFDQYGNGTQAYEDLLKSFNGKKDSGARQAIENLFDALQKLKQGWTDNTDAIIQMNDAIDETIVNKIETIFSNVDKLTKNHESNMKTLDLTFKAFGKNDFFGKSDTLEDKISEQSVYVSELQAEMNRIASTTSSADKNTEAYKNKMSGLNDEFLNAIATLKDYGQELKDLTNQKMLKEFQKDIEDSVLSLEPFSNALDNLSDKMNLLSEHDINGRMDVVSEQFQSNKDYLAQLREEYDRFAGITPKTQEEADALAGHLQSLGTNIKQAMVNTVEFQKALNTLKLDALSKPFEDMNKAIERELALVEHNLKMLEGGLLSGTDVIFGEQFASYIVPESAYEKQRDENQKIIDDQEQMQQRLLEIKQMQFEEEQRIQEAAREELRAHLESIYNSLMESYNNQNSLAGQMGGEINTTVEDSYHSPALNNQTTFNSALEGSITSSWRRIVDNVGQEVANLVAIVGNAMAQISSMSATPSISMPSIGGGGYSGGGGGGSSSGGSTSSGTRTATLPNGNTVPVTIVNGRTQENLPTGTVVHTDGGDYKITGGSSSGGYVSERVNYAEGTKNHPGGISLVGEKGKEVGILPNGKAIILGKNGAELVDLPKGTEIIPNDMLKNVPKYEDGTVSITGSIYELTKAIRENTKISASTAAELKTYREERAKTYGDENSFDFDKVLSKSGDLNQNLTDALKTMGVADDIKSQQNLILAYYNSVISGNQDVLKSISDSIPAEYKKSFSTVGDQIKALTDGILKGIDEQLAKDVQMQAKIQEDLLRQQVDNADRYRKTLEDEYNKALDDGADADYLYDLTQKISEVQDLELSLTEKLKDAVGAKYQYEFSLMDKKLNKENQLQDNINREINETQAQDPDNYSKILSLNQEILKIEKDKQIQLRANVAQLLEQQQQLEVGSYEWNLIEQQVEGYNAQLQESNVTLQQMFNNILDATLAPFEKIQSDLDYAKQLHDVLSPNDLTGLNTIYDKMGNNLQNQANVMRNLLEQLKNQQSLLSESSDEWGVINGQISAAAAKLREINIQLAEAAKTAFISYSDSIISQFGTAKAYADGTESHPGGDAIVGEEGVELGVLPDGRVILLGKNGIEFVNLPKGTEVIPNDDLKGIRHYAEGTKGANSAFDALKDIYNNKHGSEDIQESSSSTSDTAIDGLEKELEIQKLINYARENGLTLSEKQLEVINSKGAIEKTSLEMVQKELELQQLQNKLTKLQNAQSIKKLVQQEDGTYQYEYVKDLEEINRTQDEILDKRLEIVRLQKSIDEANKKESSGGGGGGGSSADTDNGLKGVMEAANDRVYKSKEELKKALEALNIKDLPIDEIVNKYWDYFLKGATIYINDALDAVKAKLKADTDSFTEAGNTAGVNYVKGISDAIGNIMSGSGDIVEKQNAILNMLADKYVDFALAGNESGKNYCKGLIDGMGTPDKQYDFNNAVNIIKNKLTANIADYTASGQDAAAALLTGLLAGISNIEKNSEITDKLSAVMALFDMTNKYGTLGNALGSEFMNGLIGVITNMSSELSGENGENPLAQAINSITQMLDTKINEFTLKGDQQGVAYAQALKAKLQEAMANANVTVDDILKILNDAKSFDLAGLLSGESYTDSLSTELDTASGEATESNSAIIDALKADIAKFSNAGAAQGEAYKSAIINAFAAAESAAKKYIDNIVAYVRNANAALSISVNSTSTTPVVQNANSIPVASADTGGLLGDWSNTNGKLMFVHPRELTLNESETKDYLSAKDYLKDLKYVKDLAQYFKNPDLSKFTSAPAQAIQQYFSFDKMEFPKITNTSGVENLINGFKTFMLQYACGNI